MKITRKIDRIIKRETRMKQPEEKIAFRYKDKRK